MSHSTATAPSAAEATRKLRASLWQKNLPVLRERLDQLASAAKAGEMGTLTAEARHEAASTAHKLAGSLGMFGHPKGTDLARELEVSFGSKGSLKSAGLTAKVKAMWTELGV